MDVGEGVKYFCKPCNFATNNKFNYDKHIKTGKHSYKCGKTKAKYECQRCKKVYKYRSGLSRHRLKCETKMEDVICNNDPHNNMLMLLSDTLAQQGELIKGLIDSQKEMIPKLGNNNNNKISINVFLNEHCKNAMNLTDFINGIKVSLEDLEYTNEHGYVKGVSNIFTKNLTDMKATERPIHCSDVKRMQFYVKEENKWDKDKENTRINHGIQTITNKAFSELKQWERAHPGYDEVNSSENVQWLMMIQKLSGGEDNNGEKNKDNIRKNISALLSIKEQLDVKSEVIN